MPSDLQVDNIKDKSATKTLATLSSSAVTLHDDVTFPAGHVIQTVQNTYNSANSQTLSSNQSFQRFTIADSSMPFTGQLTNVKANSHVYIQMALTIESANNTSAVDLGTGVGIFRESSAIFTPRVYQNYWYGMIDTGASINESKQFYHHMNIVFIDTSPATGTNNYYAGGITYNNSSLTIKSDSNFYPFVCILQEIAQ